MLQSPFWKRFSKNKLSLAGSGILIILALISILGYIITPDKTPNANNQNLAIAAQKPFFKVNFLKVRKNQTSVSSNIFKTMCFGRNDDYNFIPINSTEFRNDTIIAHQYSGTNDESFDAYFNIADVIFALQPGSKTQLQLDSIHFITIDGVKHCFKITDLYTIIQSKHLVSKTYILGTDKFGRDLLSRIMIGARISLSVGFISVFISIIIGITLGLIAGYYRGKTDSLVMWLVNVVWSVPTLLMVLSISLVLGKGFWQVFIAVGLTMWVEVTRVVRGQVISIREKEYIEAARALGYNDFRILFKHILPNVMGPVIIISAANFASAILMEAGLSFLGIGVQPPVPSWGSMIKDHYGYIILNQAHLAVIPGLAIMLVVLAFNFVGNGLRDGFDTRME